VDITKERDPQRSSTAFWLSAPWEPVTLRTKGLVYDLDIVKQATTQKN